MDSKPIFKRTICKCGKHNEWADVQTLANTKGRACSKCNGNTFTLGKKWVGCIPNDNRPGNTKTVTLFEDKASSQMELRKLWNQHDQGLKLANKTTFLTIWNLYYKDHVSHLSSSARDNYRTWYWHVANYMINEQGIKDPNKTTPDMVLKFQKWMLSPNNPTKKPYANRSVNKFISCFKTVISHSDTLSAATRLAFQLDKKCKTLPTENVSHHIPPKECIKVIQHIWQRRPALGMRSYLQTQTGMRPGDATRAEWNWFDLDNQILDFKTEKVQGQKVVRIRMKINNELTEALKQWQNQCGSNLYLFPNQDDTGPRSSNLSRENDTLKEEIGIQFTWHNFRDTYATQLYRVTKDFGLVNKMLGHSSLEQTKKYVDVEDEQFWDMKGIPEDFFSFRLNETYAI